MPNPYINAAIRSSRDHEVYFFMKNKYLRLHYAPGTYNDKILTNLRPVSSTFPALASKSFDVIDCAFDTEASEAYVFSGNRCAYIDYAPGSAQDKILAGPTTIAEMFPALKNYVFADGIDAAFRSTQGKEVYLFKGNLYCRIAYDTKKIIGRIYDIGDGFTVLKGTIFESGIDACFATHKDSQAYLFKGDKYVRIKFTPGSSNDTLLGDIRPILDGWPVLRGILPVD
ncbi:albumin-2-like [Vigna unguiculata]|uniref:Hemopexin-like repeat n=1 Tax=Vigna unguiculata TaxID=3917 RepID=A0A4D6MWN6_VIGUN|nr:albumin-2-like [Vigna unguiculata]QCE05061.1 Hemopexin-like repeat [Vigna unguiculata]